MYRKLCEGQSYARTALSSGVKSEISNFAVCLLYQMELISHVRWKIPPSDIPVFEFVPLIRADEEHTFSASKFVPREKRSNYTQSHLETVVLMYCFYNSQQFLQRDEYYFWCSCSVNITYPSQWVYFHVDFCGIKYRSNVVGKDYCGKTVRGNFSVANGP